MQYLDESEINAQCLTNKFTVKPILVISDKFASILNNEKLIHAVLYHEIGHHVNHDSLSDSEQIVTSSNINKLTRYYQKERRLTREWNADTYSIKKCGIKPNIEALLKLIKILYSNKIPKLSKLDIYNDDDIFTRYYLMKLWEKEGKRPTIKDLKNIQNKNN